MLRTISILCLGTILTSCSKKNLLTVELHATGSPVKSEEFDSYEDAASWTSESCHSLWIQAKLDGASPTFHIEAFGLDLAGHVISPPYRFEINEKSTNQMIQLDTELGDSPKIAGQNLDWSSVKCYLHNEIMHNRIFATFNRKKANKSQYPTPTASESEVHTQ